jgi:hypothetical protein
LGTEREKDVTLEIITRLLLLPVFSKRTIRVLCVQFLQKIILSDSQNSFYMLKRSILFLLLFKTVSDHHFIFLAYMAIPEED